MRARGDEWRIVDLAPGDGCCALTLVGAGARNWRRRRVLLWPFDRVVPAASPQRPRTVRFGRWLDGLRALVVATPGAGHLRAAASADISLLPYQLEPALAVVRGQACRLLLADAVGLGKTIQAGLILAELRARGELQHALVLTPVGLRDQWVDELARRFAIPATVVDRHFVRDTRATFATPVSPWALGVVSVASCDYAKRPEVLAGLAAHWWDLLIVDEAHAAAAAAERGRLIARVAARSRHVVLLSATPHAGDPAAFSRLCGTGGLDDGPIVIFRRSRREAGLGADRRVARLAVAPTTAERWMHTVLARYTRAVWTAAWRTPRAEAWLALVVLNKRALSSAASLHASVERRLQLLTDAAGDWRQPGFQFDEDGEVDAGDEAPLALGVPALADGAREREYLQALAAAAARAARHESKLDALLRLLRRVHEPVLVFTEFRDTLARVASALPPDRVAVLHGALARHERRAAERAFTSGDRQILLATDAAGEGLNLQARCRFVVNLELPWNPHRLEQRIGRVDRLGQSRRVHAVHLVARGTGEARVLARLAWKLERARVALDADEQTSATPSERDLLGTMVGARAPGDHLDGLPDAHRGSEETPPTMRLSLQRDAADEARHQEALRRIAAGRVPAAALGTATLARHLAALDRQAPWLGTAKRGPLNGLTGGPGLIVLFRGRVVTSGGRAADTGLLPVFYRVPALACVRSRREARAIAEALLRGQPPELAPLLETVQAAHLRSAGDAWRPRLALAARRERLMAAHAEAMAELAGRLVQQGLFDRRAVRAAMQQAQQQLSDRESAASRLAALDAAAALVAAGPPEPVLVLIVSGTSGATGAGCGTNG
ncbi:MAG: DEAD/DEAH box helicase [Acidobacteriota bacterium]|nr:DEAD/DEAH box helicase [Acidobacteriota bacterium]